MADLSTLARPYARAAFDYANENGAVNEWEDFLFVASNVVNDKAFRNWLENPAITALTIIRVATPRVTLITDAIAIRRARK